VLTPDQIEVRRLGPCRVRSPLRLSPEPGRGLGCFQADQARVRLPVEIHPADPPDQDLLLEPAGPRELLFFEPSQVRAAIVTCGGLCPGLNNVIRSLFLQLHHHYGVAEVVGIRYGYSGFLPDAPNPPVTLTPQLVEGIHLQGGSVLGLSRGPVAPELVVDFLERRGIQILFTLGGDGTQRGAHQIAAEAERRGLALAVVGIPKTIDNDIFFVWRSFGYYTAIARAKDIIDCAHVEATGSPNGISLVKLMGRDAGFIAAGATLASQEVNFTLIPEVAFALDGPNGLLQALHRRMAVRRHAVIVVAEGAGQDLIPGGTGERDASGNPRLKDIGLYLRDRILRYFAEQKLAVNLRYFDPSYYIRSVPATAEDALLCDQMARSAAHAALAGKTDVLIGYWYNLFLHIPLPVVTGHKRHVSPDGDLWRSVIAATGQPARFE
jgi:6-phosphofructokinase 1